MMDETAARDRASNNPPRGRDQVPWRTIGAVIGSVVLTALVLLVVREVARVLIWIGLALFFAVALAPPVGFLQRRLRLRRGLATFLVFLATAAALIALTVALALPVLSQYDHLRAQIPTWGEQIRNGQGPLGDVAHRLHADTYLQEHGEELKDSLGRLGAPAFHVLIAVGTGVVAVLTIFVLSYLMVLQGPQMLDAAFSQLAPHRQDRVRAVAKDCARTVTGYLAGNLFISLIAGATTWVVLKVLGVPFAAVVAVFVALADLVPLVGATVGAAVAVIAALTQSTTAAVVVAVWSLIYQQVENHVLQPVIMARTVSLNPLTVLISVLLGTKLAGMLGALFAIPVAGVVQVIARDIVHARRARATTTLSGATVARAGSVDG